MRLKHTRWALAYLLLLGLLPIRSVRTKAQTSPTQTLTFGAIADSYAAQNSAPTTSTPAAELRPAPPPPRYISLRSAVTGVNGRTVQRARLRMQVTGPSDIGGTIHKISNNTWNETTLNFNNKPAID